MSEIVIQVDNLGKKYIIGHQQQERYTALRDVITNSAKSLIPKILKSTDQKNSSNIYEEFWALKDISFEIKKGDRVGIIGRNGAGKSTLLKILSRITEPTKGKVSIKGRVASLLEVGTGFHPELTGRENIYLNGAILGMSREEIKKKFDEIVAFAEVEKFLDTPVKRYSSGMYVRLAFAVAAHLEPEILIVDEVLAVGDAQFQKKCLGKMEKVGQEGRTVFFVSHNMQAILKLCDRCIWIQSGEIVADNITDPVVAKYLCENQNLSGQVVWQEPKYAPGDRENIYFTATRVIDHKGINTGFVYAEEPFYVEIEYTILQPLTAAWIGFKLTTASGEVLFCSGDCNLAIKQAVTRPPGVYKGRCQIPADLLNQGNYNISLLGHIPGIKMLVNEEAVLGFEVIQKTDIAGHGRQPGVIRPNLPWVVEALT